MQKIKVNLTKDGKNYVALVPSIQEIQVITPDISKVDDLVHERIDEVREQRNAMGVSNISEMKIPVEYELDVDEFLNRFGIIKFPSYGFDKKTIELRKEIYKHITPIRSHIDESRFGAPVDKMICYYEGFREVEDGEITPEYMITVHTEEASGETARITVEEIEWQK